MPVKQVPIRPKTPWPLAAVARIPGLGPRLMRLALRLPKWPRVPLTDLAVREVAAGSVNRREMALFRGYLPASFELFPAPELNSLLGHHEPVIAGREVGLALLEQWLDAWEHFTMVPKEIVELDGNRLLILNHVYAQGAGSGLEINQDESELWEFAKGHTRMRQWWSWDEGLQAAAEFSAD